jgi:orotidine-5'-phosphate decarboxylase
MNFNEKLMNATENNNSLLCIGLDPDPELMPKGMGVFKFNKAIIDCTCDLVCAYKLNLAFYEALDGGIDAMKQTIKSIPNNIPIIGDAKRGDIGNTAKAYAKAIFDVLNFDATTVNPYLGFDTVEPFIEHWDRGVFILCRTSNPSSADFQSLPLVTEQRRLPLFEIVALRAAQWNQHGNIGLVVGATYPQELKFIRENHPDMPLLIPGIGAQGGDLASAVRYGVNPGGRKAIISSSRQIIYASKEKDFAQAARQAASTLREEMNYYRAALNLPT